MLIRTIHPLYLLITNEVHVEGPGWWAHEERLKDGISPPPIVASGLRRSGEAMVILDGNHRACMCASHRRSIKGLILMNDSDADQLIKLEHREKIQKFPHRDFLSGAMSLLELTKEALANASLLSCTVIQRAKQIRDARSAEKLKIRERLVSIRKPPPPQSSATLSPAERIEEHEAMRQDLRHLAKEVNLRKKMEFLRRAYIDARSRNHETRILTLATQFSVIIERHGWHNVEALGFKSQCLWENF